MQTISSQHHLDDAIVAAKQAAKDYVVLVSPVFTHDGETLRVVLDGHHSLEAARRDGVAAEYVEATHLDSDRIALIDRGEINDFLDASYIDGEWYNVDTRKFPWR